jgi:hypothetical protein
MPSLSLGRRGHDRMVVGFRTTYAIGAYHHYAVSLNLDQGNFNKIQIRFHFADDTFYLFWSYSPKKYQNIHFHTSTSV